SSSKYEPPCKSRPSTMWRCAHAGHVFTRSCGKKFGTAQRHTTSAVRMIASAFHRVKYNIELTRQTQENAARKKLARGRLVPGRLTLFLRRLTLGAYARNHLPHLPHADPVRNFEFDLVVVDHLRDLADETA